MKKDVRQTLALYVIICFVVFSFGYAMVPVYYAIKKTNTNVPAQAPPKVQHTIQT